MEGKIIAAVGGCAILAGVAYIFQGENKIKRETTGQTNLFPGLVNLGNTCYLNSVLQALASVSTFVTWLNTLYHSQQNKNKRLTRELSKLMQVLNNPCHEQDSYDPVSIFTSLYSHGWVITREQQDAHEIFQVITSTLAEEEEFTSKKKWNSLLEDEVSSNTTDDSIIHRSRVTASKVERKSWSPFTGLFANQLSCNSCSKKHPVKFDHFDTISLSLLMPFQFGSCSLQDLLRNFICSEILESFHCENCVHDEDKTMNKQKRFLKKISLGKLPHCLCFHINRTYWHDNGTPYKNNTFVNFPEIFNIKPFLYTSSDIEPKIEIPVNFQAFFNRMADQQKGTEESPSKRLLINTEYQLVAVIVHIGGVHQGHYVTYRKLENAKDNTWFFVSDETVQTVSLSKVLKSNAYMLFYERIH